MTDYVVNLPDGRQAHVTTPASLELKRPMPDAEAFAAIHKYVARMAAAQVVPLVHGRPQSMELVRNPQGQLARAVNLPAATAAEVATEIGELVADRYVSELEG